MNLAALLVTARGPRTVTHLAAASGLSRRTINLYERGTIPKLTTLIKLVDALGVSKGDRDAILAAHMLETAVKS